MHADTHSCERSSVTEPALTIERLLLPGERILWQGAPRRRPKGPVVFEILLGGGCFVVLVGGLLFVMLATAAQLLRGVTTEILIAQFAETGALLIAVFFGWSFFKGTYAELRRRNRHRSVSYYLTDRRIITLDANAPQEIAIEFSQLEPGEPTTLDELDEADARAFVEALAAARK